MHTSKLSNAGLVVDCLAHRDVATSLLLVRLCAPESPEQQVADAPVQLALAVDRSGSMGGEKMAIARSGAARVLRSLNEHDRVAVVSFDDRIEVLAELAAPSEAAAARVEALEARGSTALYDGWLTAARMLGHGGRVVLLSDGQANHGRYTGAADLARQARTTLTRFGIATSTIGLGNDYDEQVMAAMAQEGSGGHYFCPTPDKVVEAFAQERLLAGRIALESVSVRLGDQTQRLGFFVHGETKAFAFRCDRLDGPLTVRYRLPGAHDPVTVEVPLPVDFGSAPEAVVQRLIDDATAALDTAARVDSQGAAHELLPQVRALLLALLHHGEADGILKATITRLQLAVDRVRGLAERYDEGAASLHRKRSYQGRHAMMSPGTAYSAFADEEHLVAQDSARSFGRRAIVVDPQAFALRPPAYWIERAAAPVRVTEQSVQVTFCDHKQAFLADQMSDDLGRRVRTTSHCADREAIEAAIHAAADGMRP